MLVIIGVIWAFVQYYTSDKLALAAPGAKVVERDEAPDLHDMVESYPRWQTSQAASGWMVVGGVWWGGGW